MTEPFFKPDLDSLEEAVKSILENIGEDLSREGLIKTPKRAAKCWEYLTKGYQEDPHEIVRSAIFHENGDEMIVVKNLDFYSLCEHHMLPFFGKIHIGYIPDGKVIGFSKTGRLVEAFSKRLQIQERLTHQIAQSLQECLAPKGVAVMVSAHHLCMAMRGEKKRDSTTITQAMTGVFETDPSRREEFLNLINNSV
jgi:GTP cyclohydrolase I